MEKTIDTIENLQKEVEYYKKQLNELSGDNIRRDYKVIDMSIEIMQMTQGLALIAALNQFKPIPVFEEIYDHFTEKINVHMKMDFSMLLLPDAGVPGNFFPNHMMGKRGDGALKIQQSLKMDATFLSLQNSLLVNSETQSTPFIESLVEFSGTPYFILTPVNVKKEVIAYLFTGRRKELVLIAASRLFMHDVHTLEAIAGVIAALKNQHDQFQLIEKERARISIDMHDEIGSGITHIALLSELVQTQCKDEVGLKKDLNIIATSARKLVQSMSEIIWALNPQNDTLENLLAYTREQSQQYFESLNVKFDIVFPEQVPEIKLSNVQRRNLYLVTREALNNAMKHSAATDIQLTVKIANQLISFSVIDNGIGMNDKKIRAGSNGLTNMQKRINEICGEIAWLPLDKGTAVKFSLAFQN